MKIQIILTAIIVTIPFLSYGQIINQAMELKNNSITAVEYYKKIYDESLAEYGFEELVQVDIIHEGLTIKTKEFQNGELRVITDKTYNDIGQITDVETYKYPTLESLNAEEHNYNDLNKLDEIFFFRDDEHIKSKKYNYSKNNELESMSIYTLSNERTTLYEYYYADGLVDEIECIQDEKYVYSIIHQYDTKGNLKSRYRQRDAMEHSFVNYEYDSKNRLVKKSYEDIRFIFNTEETVHLGLMDIKLREDKIEYVFIYLPNGLLKSKTEIKNDKIVAQLNLKYLP